MASTFEAFFNLINNKNHFLICCHVHPDGDSIGSMLALGLALRQMGKKVDLVCSDEIPEVFNFLNGSESIQNQLDSPEFPEVLICVDCAEEERIALPVEVWKKPGVYRVNIDHHVTNGYFGDLNIVFPEASATGEVIYNFFSQMQIPMNQGIATAIYTTIATDTGFFRYANTSAYVLKIASALVEEFLVKPAKIAEHVHDQKSYNSMRMLGMVLNTLNIVHHGKIAWMSLDQAMLRECPVEPEETESFVNYARSIQGVEIGLLFKELKPGEIKLSWRSTAAVDVSELAAHFGGGGHARAAGCNLVGPMSEVIERVLNYLIDDYYGEKKSK